MNDGTVVRVLDFNLAEKPHEFTCLLVPGFATIFQSWQRIMELLTPEFRVVYFESREKSSSRVPRKLKRKITFERMAHDIKEVVEQMGLDNQKYITLCSSAGGTILYEALAEKWIQPTGSVAVGPSLVYNVKGYVTFLSGITPKFLMQGFFRPLIHWYLTKFYVNKKAEPEQMVKYMRALDEADMRKAIPVLRKMQKYDGWDLPPKIETPSLLIGASSDVMHAAENCKKVDFLMPNSYYVNLGSNKAAHEEPLFNEIKKFIELLEKN